MERFYNIKDRLIGCTFMGVIQNRGNVHFVFCKVLPSHDLQTYSLMHPVFPGFEVYASDKMIRQKVVNVEQNKGDYRINLETGYILLTA